MSAREFVDHWRRQKSAAFDLSTNSSAGKTVTLPLWGRQTEIYANATLSIYSAQRCNARCAFCVEELRPASRGADLAAQKQIEAQDARYFQALNETLSALAPLNPSVSVTGGEPSKDPRLIRILNCLHEAAARKLSLTTNGSGLLDRHDGLPVIEALVKAGVRHLNISRAHWDQAINARLMRYKEGPDIKAMTEIVRRAQQGGTRVRLSCVLIQGAVDSLTQILAYLDFAERLGVDNVIFRQLMLTDARTVSENYVVRYSDRKRVALEAVLDQISAHPAFSFEKQILGYYYYVEVWRYRGVDVVFEEADLARLERRKNEYPGIAQELVFHPNAKLASSWQPWDGVLGPVDSASRGIAAQPLRVSGLYA